MEIISLAEAIERDATATLRIVDEAKINLETFEVPGAVFVKRIMFKQGIPVGFLAGEMVEKTLLQLFRICFYTILTLTTSVNPWTLLLLQPQLP